MIYLTIEAVNTNMGQWQKIHVKIFLLICNSVLVMCKVFSSPFKPDISIVMAFKKVAKDNILSSSFFLLMNYYSFNLIASLWLKCLVCMMTLLRSY